MKRNDLIFVKDFDLRFSFDLLHLQSIEYLGNRVRRQSLFVKDFEFNVGLRSRLMVWAYSARSRKRVAGVHVRKYWKRKRGAMSRFVKVNPNVNRITLSQTRAGVISVAEYYDFFLARSYRNRRRRKRWDSDITLDEFFLFFEQYDLIPHLSLSSPSLSVNINFDTILSFWPASFIHIALQNARYPFWVYGGSYLPFAPFGGFAQITNHCIEPDSVEPDYWFGARSRNTQNLVDAGTRVELFVVILSWGFLFDFRGSRMFEAQFGTGFLSALMLSAALRASKYTDEYYVSEDWVAEDNEEIYDSAPITNWVAHWRAAYLYSRYEIKRMWDKFSVDFWKLPSLNFTAKFAKLFSNDLTHLVKFVRTKTLINSFHYKTPFYSTASLFTENELRFFSYNNWARPLVLFLRLLPKIIWFLRVYIRFYLSTFLVFILRIFTINKKWKTFLHNFYYNYVYNFISYVIILPRLFKDLNVAFYFRALSIFFFEITGVISLSRYSWSSNLSGLLKWAGFFFFVITLLYFLLEFMTFLCWLFIFLLASFIGFVIFRLEPDNARADKFSFFERSFKIFNSFYLGLAAFDFFFLLRYLIPLFVTLLTYLSSTVTLLFSLSPLLFKSTSWRYLNLVINYFRSVPVSDNFVPLVSVFFRNVGVVEYLCFWFRYNFMDMNSRFGLVKILNLVNMNELNWLIINISHLFCGTVGWWVNVKSTDLVTRKWRELFEFNNILNSSGAVGGSFFTMFVLRRRGVLRAFSIVFLEILFFRLAVPFSNINSKIKNALFGGNPRGFSTIFNDLFVNTLFLDSWGVFRRTRFGLKDFVLVDLSYLNLWNLLNYFLKVVLVGGVKNFLSACIYFLKNLCIMVRHVLLLLLYTLLYVILIIFMVYLVILTATLLYVCGIKAGLSIFLYISLKIIVICLILSVMRRKE